MADIIAGYSLSRCSKEAFLHYHFDAFLGHLQIFVYKTNKFVKSNLIPAYIVNNIFAFLEFNIARIYEKTASAYRVNVIKSVFEDYPYFDCIIIV